MSDDDSSSERYVPPSPQFFPESPEPYIPGSPEYLSDTDNDTSVKGGGESDGQSHDANPYEIPRNREKDQEEWEAYDDDNGLTYYYNPSTGETQWEEPARFKYVKEEDGRTTKSKEEDDEEEEEGQAAENEEPQWIAYHDNEGRTYYYNSKTKLTQWERPDSFRASPTPDATGSEEDEVDAIAEVDDAFNDDEPTARVKEEGKGIMMDEKINVDPVTKVLEMLTEMDAIMEPSCAAYVSDIVTYLGPNEGFPKAIQCLSNSFHGQTAICGLLCNWIRNFAVQTACNTNSSVVAAVSSSNSSNYSAEETVRTISEQVIHGIVMEKYHKDWDENILRLRKREVQFLEDMMDSNRWRRFLIDLSTKHKDSALLMFCLKSISKRGHHREIAGHNQSDYFGVFDSMLNYELSILGNLSVGVEGDLGGRLNTSNIGKILRESSISTDFTYLYAIEALEDLVTRAKQRCSVITVKENEGLQRAVIKWEKLREDLEKTMLANEGGLTTTLAQKRRISVALTISELHQRQRRRLDPTAVTLNINGSFKEFGESNKWKDPIDIAVLNLIRRHATSMPFDSALLNKLLKPGYDDLISLEQHGLYVGQILISHPTAITALLNILYQPGGTVVKSLELKGGCAALLARAVLAAKREANQSYKAPDELKLPNEEHLFVEVQKHLIEGSKLCDQIGNMVSFTVLDAENARITSAGIKISALSIRCSLVAKGVLLWATELVKSTEYVESATYQTLTPCILSLVRVIGTHHPFSREEASLLAFIVIEHPVSKEVSYQKVESLKRQSLRLLLNLCTQGQAIFVLNGLADRLNSKGTIDSSLIRYFMSGLLQIASPPFSIPFVKCLSTMLLSKPCVEALCYTAFKQSHLPSLQKLVQEIISVAEKNTSSIFTEKECHEMRLLLAAFS